jgi:hypothetical protein
LETHSSLETFGEEKEGAYLEEERGALHEGLSKTITLVLYFMILISL